MNELKLIRCRTLPPAVKPPKKAFKRLILSEYRPVERFSMCRQCFARPVANFGETCAFCAEQPLSVWEPRKRRDLRTIGILAALVLAAVILRWK